MNKIYALLFIILPAISFSTACEKNQTVETPPPQTLTREATGYYCLMTVVYHNGPKGQIILTDKEQPLWFTSVRDTIAFTLSPEEPKNIAAIYVNDMSDADWDNPGENNWINARDAWYVLNSKRAGGMGAPEAVPFSSEEKAKAFISEHGGKIFRFNAIPPTYVK